MAREVTHILRHLTYNGLVATGVNENLAADGSSTAVPFYYGPSTDSSGPKYVAIHRIIMVLSSAATVGADAYGNGSALTNGITLEVRTGGTTGDVVLDPFNGKTVKENAQWAEFGFAPYWIINGTGEDYAIGTWEVALTGKPIFLNANDLDFIVATVQDDLTSGTSGISRHTLMLQGHSLSAPPEFTHNYGN